MTLVQSTNASAINQRQFRPTDNRGSPQNAKTYQILKFILPGQAMPAQGNKSTVVYNSFISHMYWLGLTSRSAHVFLVISSRQGMDMVQIV